MPNKKPPVDLSQALVPLTHFRPDAVPKAGHDELAAYHGRRGRRHTAIAATAAASGAAGLLSWLFAALPFLNVVFLLVAVLSGGAVAFQFLHLALGEKSYQALPEGATEATARLEDGTRRKLFPWNGDASVWNDEARRWNEKAVAWNRLKPGDEVDGVEMTPEILVLEGRLLLEEKHRLILEREALVRRRTDIQADIDELALPKRLAARNEPKLLAPPPPKKK